MKNRPTRNQIAKLVCDEINVNLTGANGISSPKRSHRLCYARSMIVYIGQFYDYTYEELHKVAGYANYSGARAAEQRLLLGQYPTWKKVSGRIVSQLDNR